MAHRPRAPLDDLVEFLWCLSDAPGHGRERIVPNGTIQLVINLSEDEFRIYDDNGSECRFRGVIVSGCYSRAFDIEARAHALVLGVRFKPGGVALLGAPAGVLANVHVGMEDIWGRSRAAELRERLCAAAGVRERMALLEGALIARWSDRVRPRSAVRAALVELDQPGVEIGSVTAALGLSRRRFIEVFTADVGMTPKRYAMVRRFQRGLVLAAASSPVAWARIARACGYCDQAHLCRDWAELTGLSPGELVARRDGIEDKQNHVAVPVPGVKFIQDRSTSRS